MPLSAELAAGSFHTLPDGGRMRYALLEPPEKPRGTILIAPGRREFIEKKIAEMGREFLRRNFRLILFEWRGQGLSDRFLEGARRQRDCIADFSLYLDDLCSFYDAVVRKNQAGPLLAHGHSLGGHLILRWLAERQKTGVHAAFLTGPMLALGPRAMHVVTGAASRAAVRLGFGEDYAPGQHDYDAHDRAFAGNPLTQDAERYAIIERYFDAHPDMAVGGVTWAWLAAALKSMRDMRRGVSLGQIMQPVLAITGSLDRVTPAHELARYLSRLPDMQNVIISGALHDVMNEIDVYRAEAWRNIDRFLERVMAG